MKKRSSKKYGFTLLEVVISMMLITILSVGVYNTYIMMIRHTKDGEVKQEAALVGRKIVEEIKAEAGSIKKNSDGNLELKINDSTIELKKSEDSKYSSLFNNPIYVDGYQCEISIEPKMTEDNKGISLYKDDYIQYTNVLVSDNMIEESDLKNILDLSISNNGSNCKIKNTDYDIESNSIVLDFKNYIDDVTIEVTNESSKTLNLYILNSILDSFGNKNVKVENNKGSLNEYYRYDNNGKIGTLYNINVIIRSEKASNLFQSNFIQNIDIN